MGDIIKLAIVLFIISMVAGFAIGFTDSKTKETIENQRRAKDNTALASVFPEGVSTTAYKSSAEIATPHWVGKMDDITVGYAFKGSNRGYSSDIKYIIGIDTNGVIMGLSIISQVETPGLGTRLEETISKKYIWNGLFAKKVKETPWFWDQFKGISIEKNITIDKSNEWHRMTEPERKRLHNENAISGLTGATISTKAVSEGIKKTAGAYFYKCKEIYN